MPKVKAVSRALVVIGVLALSATVAHAGGGPGGGANVINPFQCYLIDGDQPPHGMDVLNIADQFGMRENVQVGRARLLCTPVTATKPDGTQFDPAPLIGDHLTCYTISPFQRGPLGRISLYNPDAVVDLTDELNRDTGVNVSIPAFLCTSSDKVCASGKDCGLPF